MFTISRTHRRLAAILALLGLTTGAIAQYPQQTIKMIVPFPAGGPTDIVARPYAEALSETLGKPVIIENRGGAGGSVGAKAVAQSTPDGYTLLLGTVGTAAINPALYPKLGYDAVKDFQTVAIVGAAPVALVVHPSVLANTVKELLALAAKRELRFGSAGNGTPGHLTGEIFKAAARVELTHMPYKGSAPALQDLLGGHLELMFDPLQAVLPQIRAGKLKVLAVSSAERARELPNTPTFAEAGVKAETSAWWGLFAPAGTPPAVIEKLAKQVVAAQNNSKIKHLQTIGIAVQAQTDRKSIDAFLSAERAKWAAAVKRSGASVD